MDCARFSAGLVLIGPADFAVSPGHARGNPIDVPQLPLQMENIPICSCGTRPTISFSFSFVFMPEVQPNVRL